MSLMKRQTMKNGGNVKVWDGKGKIWVSTL